MAKCFQVKRSAEKRGSFNSDLFADARQYLQINSIVQHRLVYMYLCVFVCMFVCVVCVGGGEGEGGMYGGVPLFAVTLSCFVQLLNLVLNFRLS